MTATQQRDSVPDWAKPKGEAGVNGDPKITDPQRTFLGDLLDRKDLTGVDPDKITAIRNCLSIAEQPEEFGLSKSKASELISWLLKRADKPREQRQASVDGVFAERIAVGVPAGRYAVESTQGELRFYSVWLSRDKKRMKVYVVHGPDESELKHNNTQIAILQKIAAAGIRQCAIRYGLEIGECSNCGRRLTNRISRELGIGPICGGRMFGGDEWKFEVRTKREEILARGEDPDEELD